MDPNEPKDPDEPAPFPAGEHDPFPPRGQELAPQGQTSAPAAGPEPDERNDWIESADPHDLPTREPRLIALGRYAFPPEPPLDEEGEAARDRRWTSRSIIVAGLFLLVFNSVSIQSWARQQEPGWITATVQQLAEVWTAQISLLGADQPRQGVREAYETARDQRFPGQPDAPPPT
ncbi:hypothetical protein [Brevundimonas sp.]|uniref:hypothetical protein n=1 Tax=Brevundimonas sp. TaxID=1871086 RepID=UPI001D7E41CB|nr:hypothetical protein [Brevundimonas sp.]MBA4001126.1 hypothetical protein [Brevundimonas sp.]